MQYFSEGNNDETFSLKKNITNTNFQDYQIQNQNLNSSGIPKILHIPVSNFYDTQERDMSYGAINGGIPLILNKEIPSVYQTNQEMTKSLIIGPEGLITNRTAPFRYRQQLLTPIFLQTTAQNTNNSLELESLSRKLIAKSEKCKSWKEKYKRLKPKIIEFESNLTQYSAEIERLNNILRGKIQEIEDLKLFQRLTIEYESQNVSLKNEIDALRKDIEYGLISKNAKITEGEVWKDKVMRYESTIVELQTKHNRVLTELDHRNTEANDLRIKISSLEGKIRELSISSSSIMELENKIAILSQEIERLQFLIRQKQDELNSWKIKYSTIETEILTKSSSIQDFQINIRSLSQEIEKLNSLNKNKSSQIVELNFSLNNLQSQLNDRDLRVKDLQTQISRFEIALQNNQQIEEKVRNYESQIVLLSQEIERLHQMNKKKQTDIDSFGKQSVSFQSEVQEKLFQISKLQEKNTLMSKETEKWKEKYSSLSSETNSFKNRLFENENKIVSLSQEIERLNSILTNKNSEIESLRFQILREETNKRSVISIQESNSAELVSKNKSLLQEVDRLNRDLKHTRDEYDSIQNKYKGLEFSSRSSINLEIESLTSSLRAKSQEIEALTTKYNYVLLYLVLLCAELEAQSNEEIKKDLPVRTSTSFGMTGISGGISGRTSLISGGGNISGRGFSPGIQSSKTSSQRSSFEVNRKF